MQRIALLSDTHGHLDPKLFKYFEGCQQIWHAGDIGTISICEELERHLPLTAVYGNIDGQDIRKIYPKYQQFTCEGVTVFMTHIGGRPGKYAPDIAPLLREQQPQLFICGHSHILKVMYDPSFQCLYMNPGAAGTQGFHHLKTVLRFTLDNKNIRDLEVIELGKK